MAAEIWVVIEYIIKIGAMGVVPENRRPASSSAWLLLILFLPLVGLPMYLLLPVFRENATAAKAS